MRVVTEQFDARLEHLVGVAQSLRSAAELPEIAALATPRADFTAALRAELMTQAPLILTPAATSLVLPTRQGGRRERRMVAAATAVVLLGGTASVAAAAQNALPGEALYPIKRAIERADVQFSGDTADQGADLLGHASSRLEEVSGLLASDGATSGPRIAGTLADFDAEAREGADLLMAAYAADRDDQSIVTVRRFAAEGLSVIERLSAAAPDESQDQLREAALMLRGIDQQASELCPTCSDLPALELPSTVLVSADVQRAMALLDGARLDNSHPVVVAKTDVRRAAAAAGRRATSDQGDVTDSGQVVAAAPQTPTASRPAAPSLPKPSTAVGAKVAPKLTTKVKSDPLETGGTLLGQSGLGAASETLLPDADAVTDLLP